MTNLYTHSPHTHCPRCNIEYNKEPDIITADYEFLYCNQCGFRYYSDVGSYRAYEIFIHDGISIYNIEWCIDNCTAVGIGKYVAGRVECIDYLDAWIEMDYLLPFDITVEQLKVYLTFS